MTAIRIQPQQVRQSGVAGVTCGDDLRAQAAALQGVPVPEMPGAMAGKYTGALSGVASRLNSLASQYGSVGEELQVRAAAAEVADAPGPAATAAAGVPLARAVRTTTTTIVGAGGTPTTVQLTTSSQGTVASTSTGARVVTPDALERPASATAAAPPGTAPDPHATPHDTPAASREVDANRQIGGAPAAAAYQAAAGGGSGSGEAGPVSPTADQSYTVDPSDMPPGEHRAEQQSLGGAGGGEGHGTPAPVDMPSAHETDRQDWACWMAATAAHEGLPPTLPVMMALAQSGLRNMPSGENDAGFFGIDPAATYAPPGAGVARDTHPAGDWWVDHPDAQLDHVVGRLSGFGGGIRDGGLDDPDALGRWASEAVPGIDPSQFSQAHAAAGELVSHCKMEHAAIAPAAGGPLSAAKSQLGVHEFGDNTGPQVNKYLATADVGPGNPWCASFVQWSVEQSGHEMPGSGWAAVSNWVNAAEAGQHGMHIVDAAHARPGDIVAYDWGGGSDFTGDGHIGFLESTVHDGQFTTVEGNADDAVTRQDRNLGVGNVVFIRMGG